MIHESDIERKFKERLNDYGFEVIKLSTPGTTGVMDRLILRPVYSPGPPLFVEFKKDNKPLRPLQIARGEDWARRGCTVLKPILNMQDCYKMIDLLIGMIANDYYEAKKRANDKI